MDQRVERRSMKTGLPPGSLVHVGTAKGVGTRLCILDYDAENLRERDGAALPECLPLRSAPTVTWINVDGLASIDVVEGLGQGFGVHPLVLEDILNPEQRPKLEDFGDYLFVVLKMLSYDALRESVHAEQVGLVLGKGYLLTFQEQGGDVFDPVRERLRKGNGRLRKLGADYLLYALVDAVIDNYFVILERFDERIEVLEEALTADARTALVHEIHALKRQMISLRKAVWPLREVVGGLERGETVLVERETRVFLRDVYDHTIQVIDTVETFRDILSGMLDVYMSTVGNRMNAIMKVLTIVGTIFIPLTFIASIYGMNLEHMPLLHARWAFPGLLAVMAGIALGMLAIFKRRGWF
jgi:magnesium transporter